MTVSSRPKTLPGSTGDFLAVVGGARRDGLEAVPGSGGRFVGMALTLIFTASVAGLSAAFAMRMALNTAMWVTVVLGIFWGLLIFNLDRLLMVTLSKRDPGKVKLAGILSRVAVATFVSITIATPITLQIFSKEVNEQLLVQHLNQVSAYQAQQGSTTLGREIAGDTALIRQDQAKLTAGNFRSADIERRISAATGTYNNAENQCTADEARQNVEANGTGGTRVVGAGPVYDAEHQVTVRDCALADNDLTAVQAAHAAENHYEAGQESTLTSAITGLNQMVASLQASQASQLAGYSATVAQSDGLLARVSALWSIPGWTAHITHIVIALLFFTIELLPILVKSLSLLGPKNQYEKAVDEMDDTSLELVRKRNRHVLDAADQQRQAQLDTSDAMGQDIRDAQLRVFKHHLAAWEASAAGGNGQAATARNGQASTATPNGQGVHP